MFYAPELCPPIVFFFFYRRNDLTFFTRDSVRRLCTSIASEAKACSKVCATCLLVWRFRVVSARLRRRRRYSRVHEIKTAKCSECVYCSRWYLHSVREFDYSQTLTRVSIGPDLRSIATGSRAFGKWQDRRDIYTQRLKCVFNSRERTAIGACGNHVCLKYALCLPADCCECFYKNRFPLEPLMLAWTVMNKECLHKQSSQNCKCFDGLF